MVQQYLYWVLQIIRICNGIGSVAISFINHYDELISCLSRVFHIRGLFQIVFVFLFVLLHCLFSLPWDKLSVNNSGVRSGLRLGGGGVCSKIYWQNWIKNHVKMTYFRSQSKFTAHSQSSISGLIIFPCHVTSDINSKFTDRFGFKNRPISILYQFTAHFRKKWGGVAPPTPSRSVRSW